MYENLYDIIRPGCISSARAVAEGLGKFDSVIDIGCGEGHWGAALSNYPVLIDNDGYNSPNRVKGTWIQADISSHDLKELRSWIKVNLRDRFNLAICLEVAEHLPEHRADELVEFVASCSDLVLWSAAIPGQGGMGHVNEQWPSYWVHKFNDLGFYCDYFGPNFWNYSEVEPWYKQNMYIITRSLAKNSYPRQEDLDPFIHPAFWSTRTGVPFP